MSDDTGTSWQGSQLGAAPGRSAVPGAMRPETGRPNACSVPRYRLGPVVIDAIDREHLLSLVTTACRTGTGLTVGNVNAHCFELLFRDEKFAEVFAKMDVVFCDGYGAKLGLRLLGAQVAERMTPPDFIDALFGQLARSGGRVFLLGDEPAVVEKMVCAVDSRFPGLVAGAHHGFFTVEDEMELEETIRASGASLVLVGMGMPRQEEWIMRSRDSLPRCSMMAVGALFRWYTNTERRGPRWLTDFGFEWFCRLVMQPRRVAHRYLIGLPQFGWRVVRLWLAGQRAIRI